MKNLTPPLLFFLFGAIPATIMLMVYMHQRKQLDWPSIRAKVTATDTEKRRQNNPATIWLDYSFKVNGATYEGRGLAPDPYDMEEYFYSTSLYRRKEVLDWWREQENVMVIYNPEEPAVSSTFPDINTGWLVGGIIFGLFALLGLAGVITALTGANGGRKNMMVTREQHNQVLREMMKRK